MISRLTVRVVVAAFGLAVLVSLSGVTSAHATPSIPIPPPVSGPGLHGR